MEKVLNNMFLGERKQGNWFQFHLPTVKSVKALLCMYDFAFQNSNTVTVTQKKSFSETVNCQTVTPGVNWRCPQKQEPVLVKPIFPFQKL